MVSRLLSLLGTPWAKVTLALALIGLGAATAKSVAEVTGVPALLRQHDSTTQAQTTILTKMYLVQLTSLCIEVSDREHTDWTRCLLPAGTSTPAVP